MHGYVFFLEADGDTAARHMSRAVDAIAASISRVADKHRAQR